MDESYGQFCTVARGAEVLCSRWTPLVVRELLCGSKRFNDLRRGVPRMSTSLLAERLRQLESVGIIRRHAAGKVWEYSLTDAGEELRPIIMALGHWGARWVGSDLRDDELDVTLLMWDVRRSVRLAAFPPRPVVVNFRFHDAREGERLWWLVVEDGCADLCREDPGREVTLLVHSTVRALIEIWRGDITAQEALRSGQLRVEGAGHDAQSLWNWLGTGTFAQTRQQARALGMGVALH